MSKGFSARINKHCLDEQKLEKLMVSFFKEDQTLWKRKWEYSTCYNGYDEEHGILIYFVEKKLPPYNTWLCDITNSEFKFNHKILLDVDMERDTRYINKTALEFYRYVQEQTGSAIHITSDLYGDVCLMQEDGTVLEAPRRDYSRLIGFDPDAEENET